MPRSLQEILDQAEELADRFEAYEPVHDVTTPEMLLRRAAWKRAQAERDVVEAVVEARGEGVPWSTIGGVLGTSPQAAQKRYSAVVTARVTKSGKSSVAAPSGKRTGKRVKPAKSAANRALK